MFDIKRSYEAGAWGIFSLVCCCFMLFIAPPPPAVRAGGAGGLVLPEETPAHASETLAYSGISVRHVDNSIRKGAFEGELSSGASVLRVSVQQFPRCFAGLPKVVVIQCALRTCRRKLRHSCEEISEARPTRERCCHHTERACDASRLVRVDTAWCTPTSSMHNAACTIPVIECTQEPFECSVHI